MSALGQLFVFVWGNYIQINAFVISTEVVLWVLLSSLLLVDNQPCVTDYPDH